ncbi:MAG: hypothetical protein ACOH5I_25380 [Oligoflexus sp.]
MKLKVTGDVRKNPIRKLLLRNHSKLKAFERRAVRKWLELYPEVKEVYETKELVCAYSCIRKSKRAEKNIRWSRSFSSQVKIKPSLCG